MTDDAGGPALRGAQLDLVRAGLGAPRDCAALVLFRVLFGLLLMGSALRFIAYGWVGRFFGERSFFFKYWGFAWVKTLSEQGMLAVYLAIALCGLLVALG